MEKRTPSSDKTQIGEPAKPVEKIPERYQASLVIVEGHSPKNWGVGGKPWPVDQMPPGPSS